MKMCQAFQNNDFDVELLCYTTQKDFSNDEVFKKYGIKNQFDIRALFLKNMRGKFFQKFFSIFKLLNTYNKDSIIYGRDIYSVYLSSLLGFDVIYESHGFPSTTLYGMIEKQLLKNSKLKKLVVISDKLKEIYLENNILRDSEKILVLHDGADELDLSKKGIDLGDGFHIGYIGSLYYEGRGVDVILEVAKLNPSFTFHFVGGKDEEVKYWQDKASKNVKFYGFLSHSEATKYLLSFDVVLMPYQKNLKLADNKVNTSSWMSPMKMFEYMSAKKAIVSSNMLVIKEVLNENNSILVEPDNVDEWSDAVNKLYENSDMRNSIADKSYNEFVKYYTWLNRARL
jgi:glycosyltransferase involved in cell wall biosynthesis